MKFNFSQEIQFLINIQILLEIQLHEILFHYRFVSLFIYVRLLLQPPLAISTASCRRYRERPVLRSQGYTQPTCISVCGALHSVGTQRIWTCTALTTCITVLPSSGTGSRQMTRTNWNSYPALSSRTISETARHSYVTR